MIGLSHSNLAFRSSQGFAALANNNGHDGNGGLAFYNNPEVVEDFVYRATLMVTQIGKAAGLRIVQTFPEEYDGIVAGTPANDLIALEVAWGQYFKSLGLGKADSPILPTSDQWSAVRDLIIDQCDCIDGAIDKVYAVRQLYQPFYGNNATLIYPRFQPGCEEGAKDLLASGQPPAVLTQLFKYMISNDPDWTLENKFTLNAVDHAMGLDLFDLSTQDDLTKLQESGNKLLTYHGLMDSVISSENPYRYYEHVSRSMGLPSADLDNFFRYFSISGLDHCGGGNGAWYMGSPVHGATFDLALNTTMSEKDGVLMSIVRWVEEVVVPERLAGGNIMNFLDGNLPTRNHCRYPLENTYKGSGNPKFSESW
ncbi:hypothetical protein ABW20_dc0110683 [Dactylellina cionopaga]|nr:hypothetical protein ABW20_dc0110683 [Dactylellina cionopaga]